ncbi:hypothetical protein EMIHUDRAFT_252139 [Emiliania huxleyi CCMP1516]|uniref:Uncharacterized protein n=2 Tax=Emiliania huxleyi TaxID=2903 RepID=A0A0D3KNI3_EMIH1|nr:hypothetical protein EMIHUDRAFT_252139 [Emiliania huxleyi CCMP1516]EOD37318.1 hypothetical protein EMIHUDRAFT_252139 [Emiliania huxleyi CCMP1516]|eukprot:XP_005789747.1 hypothetical protein EMIHUDRAFT_252139 [Emiliania huxleyi CCMP1516]
MSANWASVADEDASSAASDWRPDVPAVSSAPSARCSHVDALSVSRAETGLQEASSARGAT